jgi:glycerol-3-phosphate dehydrogenase
MTERTQLAALQQEWDIVVVGGGITGAGVAREAARRGLSVLLLEQRVFSWGTSCRSSKMVHGGLRYLAAGDIALTRDALGERERLLREAPGLIERMGYYFLLKKSWLPMKAGMALILRLYDGMAGVNERRSVNRGELQARFSSLETASLSGAAYFTDTVTDDSRLTLRVLQEAEADGAVVMNYCQVQSCERLDEEWQQLQVADRADEATKSVLLKARVVVNSTGAWADSLRRERCEEQRVRPLKGSHIVLKKGVLPVTDAISCSHPQDRRSVFIFPWLGHTVIGTTDLDYESSLNDEAAISDAEVDYLLAIAQKHFPDEGLGREHIISTWSGVRPVIASDADYQRSQQGARKKPSSERRDHAVWDNDGLVSASGGKLTTFRLMALDVLEAAARYLPGFEFVRDDAPVFTALPEQTDARLKQLQGRYGVQYGSYIASARQQEMSPLQDTPFSLADCRWALRNEHVVHLDDLMLRRTRLGLILSNGGEQLLPRIRVLCEEELGWDEERWSKESERYKSIWQGAYSLPQDAV